MKKILILPLLLLVANATAIQAAAGRNLRNNNVINNNIIYEQGYNQPEPTQANLLDQMHVAYARQATNQGKIQFISSILEQQNVTLEEKILQIQALQRVIDADISLHSGWLWNLPEDQVQIDWLKERKALVQRRLAEIEWQAKSYGYKTAYQTAKYMSIYLGAMLAVFLAQSQYAKMAGTQPMNYGQIAAWLPVQSIKLGANAAAWSIDALTSPAAQDFGRALYNGAAAVAKAGWEYGYAGVYAIGQAVPAALKEGTHQVAEAVTKATEIPSRSALGYFE